MDMVTQLDQTRLSVTSYGTRNQTDKPGQIQGLGNLIGHISYDEKIVLSCLGKYLKGSGA